MKTNILKLFTVLLVLAVSFISCKNSMEESFSIVDETPIAVTAEGEGSIISACGVSDPAKNLTWLVELIEKANTDKTGNYTGKIWLEKFKGQDIFVTNMMLGSGGVAYWFFDCSGNHFISKNWGYESCPACKFVGNHHVFVEDEEEFDSFMLNMKLDVVIYTPY